MSTAWIDYKKANDSMPNNAWNACNAWHYCKANKALIRPISRPLHTVWHAVCPLLFCICLNSLSHIVTNCENGYSFRSEVTICHLLYMEDIKLYAKSDRDIDSLIHLTRIYSKDIEMAFKLDK